MIVAFGVHLARETFPTSKKFAYPPIMIDQHKQVTSAALVTINHEATKISINQSWLLTLMPEDHSSVSTHTFMNEGIIKVVSTAVEEFSHWVLCQAIERRRSKQFIGLLSNHYETNLNQLEIATNKVDVLFQELEQYNWLRIFYLSLTGKRQRQISNIEKELNKAKAALLEHESTIEEYMGIIWRNAVAQKYYPWSSAAQRAAEQLAEVTAYKREQAAHRRQKS